MSQQQQRVELSLSVEARDHLAEIFALASAAAGTEGSLQRIDLSTPIEKDQEVERLKRARAVALRERDQWEREHAEMERERDDALAKAECHAQIAPTEGPEVERRATGEPIRRMDGAQVLQLAQADPGPLWITSGVEVMPSADHQAQLAEKDREIERVRESAQIALKEQIKLESAAFARALANKQRAEKAERGQKEATVRWAEERDRRREIESKLESGYAFCHPESDCEGLRKWMEVEERASKLEGLGVEVAELLQKWARVKRRNAKSVSGDTEKLKLEWVAKGYDGAADLIADRLQAQHSHDSKSSPDKGSGAVAEGQDLQSALHSPEEGEKTGVHCESCDREQLVGDEGWESRDMLDWCPDCFEEDDHPPAPKCDGSGVTGGDMDARQCPGCSACAPDTLQVEQGEDRIMYVRRLPDGPRHRLDDLVPPTDTPSQPPVSGLSDEDLLDTGSKVLGRRAYERTMSDLPLVTPRWDASDERVRSAFILRAWDDLKHFVLPALANKSPQPEEARER